MQIVKSAPAAIEVAGGVKLGLIKNEIRQFRRGSFDINGN